MDGGVVQTCNDYDCCVNDQPVADGRACIKVAAKTCRGVCDDTLHEVVLEGFCDPGVGRCVPIDGVEYERAVQCDVGACVPADGWAGCVEAPMCGPISECSGHDDGQGCGAGLVAARCVGQMCARWAGSSPVDNDRVPLLDLAVHEVVGRFAVDGAVATGMVLTDTATHREWTLPSEASFGDLRAAHAYCSQLGTLGGGWRMPTWHEMASVLTVMRVGGARLRQDLGDRIEPWIFDGWLGIRSAVGPGEVLAADLAEGELALLGGLGVPPASFQVACVRPVQGAASWVVDGDRRAEVLRQDRVDVLTGVQWRLLPAVGEVLYARAAEACSAFDDAVLPTLGQLAAVFSTHAASADEGPTDALLAQQGVGRFWVKVPGAALTERWVVDFGRGEIKRMEAGGRASVRCVDRALAGQ